MAYWMCSGGDISDREADHLISGQAQSVDNGKDIIRRKLAECATSPDGGDVEEHDVFVYAHQKHAIKVLEKALKMAFPFDSVWMNPFFSSKQDITAHIYYRTSSSLELRAWVIPVNSRWKKSVRTVTA
jgi:hypothetical protein